MYNLAKLLTEEPEKLERLGISFVKLLITLFIGSELFNLTINLSSFIDHPIQKSISVSKFFNFLISLSIIWFLVWNIFTELIIEQLLFGLLSKLFNKSEIFEDILLFLKVIKKNNSNVTPNKNFERFNNFIQNYTEEDSEIISDYNSRVSQYCLLAIVIFIVYLISNDLNIPNYLKWIIGFIIFIFVISIVLIKQLQKYINANISEIKNQYEKLAYSYKIESTINKNKFINNYYDIEKNLKKIWLTQKDKIEGIPEKITLIPLFFNNETIAIDILKNGLKNGSSNEQDKIKNKKYFVIISNIFPNDTLSKEIKKQQNLIYLYCKDESEIIENIEILFFKICPDIYTMDY